MALFQNIVVILIFLLALGYLITKFVWKPAFLKKKSSNGCSSDGCGCH